MVTSGSLLTSGTLINHCEDHGLGLLLPMFEVCHNTGTKTFKKETNKWQRFPFVPESQRYSGCWLYIYRFSDLKSMETVPEEEVRYKVSRNLCRTENSSGKIAIISLREMFWLREALEEYCISNKKIKWSHSLPHGKRRWEHKRHH